MKIVECDTLKSKVKRCNYCGKKNIIIFSNIKLAPRSGYDKENGGHSYFECEYCKKSNYISERIVRKLNRK